MEPVEADTLLWGMGERYDVVLAARSGAWPIAAGKGKGASAAAVLRTTDASASTAPSVDASPVELAGQLLTYNDLKAASTVALSDVMTDSERDVALTGRHDGLQLGHRRPLVRKLQADRRAVRATGPAGAAQQDCDVASDAPSRPHVPRRGSADGPRKDTVNFCQVRW